MFIKNNTELRKQISEYIIRYKTIQISILDELLTIKKFRSDKNAEMVLLITNLGFDLILDYERYFIRYKEGIEGFYYLFSNFIYNFDSVTNVNNMEFSNITKQKMMKLMLSIHYPVIKELTSPTIEKIFQIIIDTLVNFIYTIKELDSLHESNKPIYIVDNFKCAFINPERMVENINIIFSDLTNKNEVFIYNYSSIRGQIDFKEKLKVKLIDFGFQNINEVEHNEN